MIAGRWIQTLKEHGTAYGQYREDLEALRRAAHERLGKANPEKPYVVASIQGEIKAYDDLINHLAQFEQKESHGRERHQQLSDARIIRAS